MRVQDHEQVGRVVADITIINRADQIRAEAGVISPDEIRSVTLKNVLVDTGATTLSLPSHIIEQLGLPILREIDIMTAMGVDKSRLYRDASLILCGRESTVECVELPNSLEPLIGVIPLEQMGIELDLQKQTLKVLPFTSNNTYITVL